MPLHRPIACAADDPGSKCLGRSRPRRNSQTYASNVGHRQRWPHDWSGDAHNSRPRISTMTVRATSHTNPSSICHIIRHAVSAGSCSQPVRICASRTVTSVAACRGMGYCSSPESESAIPRLAVQTGAVYFSPQQKVAQSSSNALALSLLDV
jgi:hypothetical protein